MHRKTLVLTSVQNYVWQSMQEIIPFIVETWKATQSVNNQVRVINIDQEKLASYFKDLIETSTIVFTCFTPQLFRIAAYVRNDLKLNCKFIIHLHNQATIACWPIRYWGGADLIQSRDQFISSCSRDSECLKITYPEASSHIIPFSYKKASRENVFSPPDEKETPFIFIGRISSQKNIHTALLAFKHLKAEKPNAKWSFHIYGQEDRLGSPNMGISESGYLDYLIELCQNLELKENVIFHGYQDREDIKKVLNQRRHIFISASLHSDENFGMAVFQGLINNHSAVLSDWGGHTDFKIYFEDQVELVKVYRTSNGPTVNPVELMSGIEKSMDAYSAFRGTRLPEHYSFNSIVQKNLAVLLSESVSIQNQKSTSISDEIYEVVANQNLSANPVIFESYKDKRVQPFLESYGMKHDLKKYDQKNKSYIAPWVKTQGDTIIVNDYHKGQQSRRTDGTENSWLYEQGYLYQAGSL